MTAPQPVRRVAIVTGSTGATGHELAVLLAERGWDLALDHRKRRDRAETTAAACRERGARAHLAELDVTGDASCTAFVASVVAEFGRVDALASLASYAAPGGAYQVPLASLDLDHVRRCFEVDVLGALRMLRTCLPSLRSASRPDARSAVVTFGSESARRRDPDLLAYLGPKVAIDAYTEALARELGPDVRINCISPGAIETDWVTSWKLPADERRALEEASCLGRLGTARDAARAAAFLLSEEAAFVTGQTLPVDGGLFCP